MRILHRAPLLLPPDRPEIRDGGLLLAGGEILAVGPYHELAALGQHEQVVDHPDTVIMPSLINGHCHLELSGLGGVSAGPQTAGDMTGWIKRLLAARMAASADELAKAAKAQLQKFQAQGVGALLDIANDLSLAPKGEDGVAVTTLLEFLGLSQERQGQAISQLPKLPAETGVTAHAPHTSGAELLVALKARARAGQKTFSIHVAESLAELEFLMTGQGPFRHFLEEIGGWDGTFQPPACGPVAYLDRLGLLDQNSLCVHAVHLSDMELEILAKSGAAVCLCPGSNRYLGVGKAPVEKLLAAGILPYLGTDSRASNKKLSLWREMRLLAEDFPTLDPAVILAMATRGSGASFNRSRPARWLAVSCPDPAAVSGEFLVRDPAVKEVTWL